MGMISWIALALVTGLLAAILLLVYLLVTSRTTRTGRHRHSHRGYGSGTPALVRAEKRLYQDWRPSADQRRGPRCPKTSSTLEIQN